MKKLILVITSLLLSSTPAFSAYDDDEISGSRVILSQEEASIFDETRIHLGVSLIQSMQDYLIAPGVRERGGLRGFQLALGLDFFSPQWIVEGIIMNFPQNSISDTDVALTGFELRVNYEKPIFYGITVHGGAGVANRVYNVKTQNREGIVVQSDRSFTSGASVLALGLTYWPSGEVSAGVEVTNHLPMARGDDPSSVDLSFKLTGHF